MKELDAKRKHGVVDKVEKLIDFSRLSTHQIVNVSPFQSQEP